MNDNSTESVWQQFLNGGWDYNMNTTFYDNGTTEMRFWNFLEIPEAVDAGAMPKLSILGTDGRAMLSDNKKTTLPAGVAKRLRLKNALAMKQQKTEATGVSD